MKKEKERKEDNSVFHVGCGVERIKIESRDQLGAN